MAGARNEDKQLNHYEAALSALLNVMAEQGASISTGTVTVSLDMLADVIEKQGIYDEVSQDTVLKFLMQLHNMGRIRLSPRIRLLQQGKSRRNIVATAELAFCEPPYRKPKKTFDVSAPSSEIVLQDILTKAERKAIQNTIKIMRGDPATAKEFARILKDIAASE